MKKYSPFITSAITILLLLISSMSCVSGKVYKYAYTKPITSGRWLRNIKVPVTIGENAKYVTIQIYFPRKYKAGNVLPVIIALHSRRGNLRDWEVNTRIESMADSKNFIIVCPNMRQSMYESRFFPQTKTKWSPIPGSKFVGKVLIDYLRKTFALAQRREKTAILGLSTGARGAMLVSSLYPKRIGAAAGFSGDYDHLQLRWDKLFTSILGPYNKFPKRWKTTDNIVKLSKNLKNTPVFLAHGKGDRYIAVKQSFALFLAIKAHNENYPNNYKVYSYIKKRAVHDWQFWRKALPLAIKFFDKDLFNKGKK